MVLCAALALMLQKEPVLTYETPAQPIEEVLLALSKQAGAPLHASTELRDEPLVVRFGAVPLSEAKARIAKVTSAEWEQLPQGGWRLTRSDALTRKLEEEALQKRIKLLQPHLDKLRQELASEPPLNPERAKMLAAKMAGSWETAQRDHENYAAHMEAQGFGPWSPQARALKQILLGIDPARLATIERGRSRVFSNVPTAFQEELPQELCANVLSEYGHARGLVKEELAAKGMDGDKLRENPYGYVLAVTNMAAADPTRLVLIVECDVLGELTSKLIGLNDEGELILQDTRRFVSTPKSYLDSPELKSRLAKYQNHPGLEEGDFLTDVSELIRAIGANPNGSRISARSMDRILSPETYDPLTPLGELLLKWADLENQNLVAYPPDSALGACFALAQGQKVKIPQLVDLMYGYGAETSLDEGWIESPPSFPLDASSERTSRDVLGTFLRTAKEEGFLSIKNQVEFAAGCGQSKPFMLHALVFFCLNQRQMNSADWDVLRLAATLHEADADFMKVGTSLGSLPTEVQENYLRVLLNAEGWERPAKVNEVYDTPTEFLPESLGDCRTFLKERTEPKFWLKYEGDSVVNEQMIDLHGLASMMYWEERQPGEFKCLAVGEVGVHELAFTAQVCGRVKRFKLEEFRNPSTMYPMDSLPGELRAKLTAEIAAVAREQEKRVAGP